MFRITKSCLNHINIHRKYHQHSQSADFFVSLSRNILNNAIYGYYSNQDPKQIALILDQYIDYYRKHNETHIFLQQLETNQKINPYPSNELLEFIQNCRRNKYYSPHMYYKFDDWLSKNTSYP